MNKIVFSISLIVLSCSVFAQSGGDNIYDFLNITNSARVASLGGQHISHPDSDLNFVYHNPSLLTSEMGNSLVLNYISYFAGTNFGYVGYSPNLNKKLNLAAGLHYLNYGEFIEADPTGQKTGTFRAADYALNIYASKTLLDSTLSIGLTFKPIYSQLESYSSFGIAFDAGITYYNKEKLFTAALVIKNAGVQLTRYNASQPREPLPFEIQLGISKRLRHAPFRFSVTGHQLQKPNLLYETEQDKEERIDPITGEEKQEDKLGQFADNFMRHVIFGVEFIPSENFYINLGYNYKRRQELKIEDKVGMVGFSFGAGIKISKFRISYGRSTYHLAGASNHFSVMVNLSEFGNKL
ncbi:MAG TPA: hypothetical protein DDX98_15075 [Bacteroidales bacterium]|jgi:hypothetical protein|nr:hypothetical protein [Bacteroidales bacterium]